MTMRYESLFSGTPQVEALKAVPPLPAFAEATLRFVGALSANLMRLREARAYPELTALAFWMRKANLERLRVDLHKRVGDALLVPRGTVLHIAPSNVDTIFVYSWFLSLLMGNRNIVRISSKPSRQADLLLDAISSLLDDESHAAIAQRTLLVRYAPDDRVTEHFSKMCDVRVIWGGDSTVQSIRRLALPPTSTEVAFSSKYSLALLHAQRWLDADEARKTVWAEGFYNDAYWFDQMACSSPRLVLWVGSMEQVEKSAADFWPRVEAILKARHERLADIDYVNKLVAQHVLAIESDVRIPAGSSNDLTRVWLEVPALHERHHCGSGLFFESALPDLEALRGLLTRTVQTVSYACFSKEELYDFVASGPMAGIDRIVPFGRALDFTPVWDGFDLLRIFTREVSLA